MATKTISIELDVYERLKNLKSTPSESFSQVLRRSLTGPTYWTAGDLVRAIERGEWKRIGLTDDEIRAIEEADHTDFPDIEDWDAVCRSSSLILAF